MSNLQPSNNRSHHDTLDNSKQTNRHMATRNNEIANSLWQTLGRKAAHDIQILLGLEGGGDCSGDRGKMYLSAHSLPPSCPRTLEHNSPTSTTISINPPLLQISSILDDEGLCFIFHYLRQDIGEWANFVGGLSSTPNHKTTELQNHRIDESPNR